MNEFRAFVRLFVVLFVDGWGGDENPTRMLHESTNAGPTRASAGGPLASGTLEEPQKCWDKRGQAGRRAHDPLNMVRHPTDGHSRHL